MTAIALPGEPPADELAALVALAGLPGIGPATLLGWWHGVGAVDAWRAAQAGRLHQLPGLHLPPKVTAAELADRAASVARRVEPSAVLEAHRLAGIRLLAHGWPPYPGALEDDPAPPAVLFARGRLEALQADAIGVVGTRNATHVGRRTAGELGRDLARQGVAVVSGLALGVDGAAHRGVLDEIARGSTGASVGRPIGVVGCGLDRTYPSRHRQLHHEVVAEGLLLSEHPLGVAPAPWRFPARNRIIAGLSAALVVVESRSSGGSMLTVNEALARDRPVLAVPGHPSSQAAAGALDLISEGAHVLRDVEDAMVAIGRGGEGAAAKRRPTSPPRSADDPEQRAVLDLLALGPRSLEELVSSMGAGVVHVASVVDEMERCGLVVRSGGWIEMQGGGSARG
jgi:DNA processing protein